MVVLDQVEYGKTPDNKLLILFVKWSIFKAKYSK